MSRRLVEGLAARKVDVRVLVLRTGELKAVQQLGNVPVVAPHPLSYFLGSRVFADPNLAADIYHTQEPNLGTFRMWQQHPEAKHVVTCIDPRDNDDWAEEYSKFSLRKKILYPAIRYFEDNGLIRRAVQSADCVVCQTKFIRPKCVSLYGLEETPIFIGNPVDFPVEPPKKSSKPMVVFLARFDRRKRPELFFELAKKFPNVDFVAIGKAHDPAWDNELRRRYESLGNVEFTGYIDPFSSGRIAEILGRAWILVNTATREGLPSAFVEATSYRCAILSTVDPDGFASEFGYYAKTSDDLEAGLEHLLSGNNWKDCGRKGFEYSLKNFETSRVIDRHLELYEQLMSTQAKG